MCQGICGLSGLARHASKGRNQVEDSFKGVRRLWQKHSVRGCWRYSDSKGTMVSEPDVMEEFFAKQPKFKIFKDRGPPFKHELHGT